MLRTLSVVHARDDWARPGPSSARSEVDIYTGRLRALSLAKGVRPAPSGTATVTRVGNRIRCTIWARDLRGVTDAELRVGTPGPEGVMVVPLFHDNSGVDMAQGVLLSTAFGDGDVPGTTGVTVGPLMAMMARGGAYVTVRTVARPEGEIGGWITLR